MKVLVLGGFLGSGKTSILLQLARYIVDSSVSDSEYKVAILENEIGQVGVDDMTLRAGGYQVDNLFAGCACCTAAGELPAAIDKISKDLTPEWIIVEATGVAYPLKMKETVESYLKIEGRICAVVDAQRWSRLLVPLNTLVSGQLEDAETLLINKVDLVDDATLEAVKSSVREYNTHAEILPVSAVSEIDKTVWQKVLGEI